MCVAIKVSRRQISFAFNLGQFYALIAGRAVYDCEPQHLTVAARRGGVVDGG